MPPERGVNHTSFHGGLDYRLFTFECKFDFGGHT